MRLILRNLRIALRQLGKTPGFSLTIILMLALGIGATTAMFSLIEGILLRPLAFIDPSRLVLLGDHVANSPGAGVTAREIVDFPTPLPVGRIPGVGIVTVEKLGLRSVGEIRARTFEELRTHFGRYGQRLYELAKRNRRKPSRPQPADPVNLRRGYVRAVGCAPDSSESIGRLMRDKSRLVFNYSGVGPAGRWPSL